MAETDLFFVILLFVTCSHYTTDAQLTVAVNNGSHFVDALCNADKDGLIIVLNHSLSYEIDVNRTCSVNNSVTIKTDNAMNITKIVCNVSKDKNLSTVSFGFVDVNITISNVSFIDCGALLSNFDRHFIDRINSSSLHFTKNHSGLFVFVNCSVEFFQVTIKYPGFTVIGVNLRHSQFIYVMITNNLQAKVGTGSGMLLLYNNDTANILSRPKITLLHSHFLSNAAVYSGNKQMCISSLYPSISKSSRLINAGALTIIFNKLNASHPVILINDTIIKGNFGSFGGGIMILMLGTSRGRVEIIDSTLAQNIIFHNCVGSSLILYANSVSTEDVSPLKVIRTRIVHNGLLFLGSPLKLDFTLCGSVAIDVCNFKSKFLIHFKNVTFIENKGSKFGSGLTVTSSSSTTQVITILESVIARDNTQKLMSMFPLPDSGIFIFNNIHCIIVNGSDTHPSIFTNNHGSVIKTLHSYVVLGGHVTFHENHAINGAALNMRDSVLFFKNVTNLTVVANKVDQFGGAFYITKDYFSGLPKCVMLFDPLHSPVSSFINNSAGLSGNSVYAYPIYDCYIDDTYEIVTETSYYFRHLIGKDDMKSFQNRSEISTRPLRLQKCHQHNRLHLFAGETLHVEIAAYDLANNSGHTEVSIAIHSVHELNQLTFHVLESEKIQTVHEIVNNKCSIINITVLLPIGYYDSSCLLYLTPTKSTVFSPFVLTIDECPPGFTLKNGVCKCSAAVVKFFKHSQYYVGECNIKDLSISKPPGLSPWMGRRSVSNDFVITSNCPLGFCKRIDHLASFKFDKHSDKYAVVSLLSDVTELCRKHRVGPMCENCEPGYSVVFGSDKCEKCSNNWISLVIVYFVVGPLLLYVIYFFDLTLATGTLNGVIFFGQVSQAGLIQSMVLFCDNQQQPYLISFLSLLNMNAPLSTCFYDGMDEIWKTGLRFFFPVYLLSIVGVIILLCKCSSWLSKKFSRHSTQILVTIMHLSVINLLGLIIDVVIPVTVYTDNGTYTAWNRNSSIEYLSKDHAVVFGITVFTTSILLIPYLLMLLFGKQCMKRSIKCNIYVRPYLEAIHAPYKESRDYWFVLRLLFVISLYILYNMKPSMLFFIIAVSLSILLLAQMFLRPMKNKLLNIVDFLIVFNITMSYFILFFFFSKETINSRIMNNLFFTSLYAVMGVFICILIYHVAKAFRILKKLQSAVPGMNAYFKNNCFFKKLMLSKIHSASPRNASDSYYSSCDGCREPLLDRTNDF